MCRLLYNSFGDFMSKKKRKNNNSQVSNEIKMMKNDLKRMIDEMSDEEFIDFNILLIHCIENFDDYLDDDEDWDDDDWDAEDWEDDAEEFYNSGKDPFSIDEDDVLPF